MYVCIYIHIITHIHTRREKPHLDRRGQHVHNHVTHQRELVKLLGTRLDKELDLCLGELPLPDKPASGSDLITVRLANLRNAERHTFIVLLRAELVVEKDSLSSLGAEVSLQKTRGPDRRREHEVELVRIREVVAGFGRLDSVFLQFGAKFLFAERVCCGEVLRVCGYLCVVCLNFACVMVMCKRELGYLGT